MGRRLSSARILALAVSLVLGVSTGILGSERPVAASTCPGCRAADARTQVSFSAVVSANRLVFDDITVLDAQGAPLEPARYERVPPTNAAGTDHSTGPVLLIDPNVSFSLGLDGRNVRDAEPFTVTVVRRGETSSVRIEELDSALSGHVAFDPAGALVFRGTSPRQVRITRTQEAIGASYRFVATQRGSAARTGLMMRALGNGTRVSFRETEPVASQWSLVLRSTTKADSSSFRATGLKVAQGDQLVVVYGAWRGSIGRPSLWLDRHSDGHLDLRLPVTRG